MSEYQNASIRAIAPKRVLIACEYSGIVRDAFIAEGHDAISCDLLPTERPGPHIQGDVRELLREPWDLVIAHPPCTYLTVARAPMRDFPETADAINFFIDCQFSNAPMVAVENPLPFKAVRKYIGEPSCTVHPWHFGDPYLKRTCWRLKALPPLLPLIAGTDQLLPSLVGGTNSQKTGRKALHRSAKKRSEFHPGMAAAMALQWGSL